MYDLIPLGLALAVLVLLLRPGVRDAPVWRATVTPLASIIGSGFLIVAPLLVATVGAWSVAAMLLIVAVSLWTGSAIRYNICHDGGDLPGAALPGVARLERVAETALAAAYVISIAFYLRLMAAFVLDGFAAYSETRADALAITLMVFIGLYGWRRGLLGLERLEEYSVSVKLSIIGALLLWLVGYDAQHGYRMDSFPADGMGIVEQLRILGGMLLVVQGFETSRYLGSEYAGGLRARTMLRAQLIAGAIYVLFVAFSLPLFESMDHGDVSETAIIGMSAMITPVLPPLLVLAAVMSQFSAAIADTIGAGGVIERETAARVSIRRSYLLIAATSCLLIGLTNIFELVSIASRAFALYYLIQAVLALRLSWALEHGGARIVRVGAYGLLAGLMALIVLLGKAVEG